MAERYNHHDIEQHAREKWEKLDLYTTDLANTDKEPYYLLCEFPYPSGNLHIGHWYAYSVPDIYARMLRMQGKNVLFPIGFDSFGLPAENAAIKSGANPKEWTYANMDHMREQMRTMGTSADWSKQVVTSDPEYYQWTQWLFTKLFEQGLAERREAAVKWCPKDQTALANEQVINGACERCGTEVVERRLTQWFLKITKYAERLLEDLNGLPWPEEIKQAQRAWIGKSEGAKLRFDLTPSFQGRTLESIEVFTTRPDTVFGATYVVVAPEHTLVTELIQEQAITNAKEVSTYIEATKKKTERERQEEKEKTGVELMGVRAVNPATHEEIPIYVADYVLGSYGTGAVMAVPAHDERDYEFAKKYELPIRTVVEPLFVKTDGADAIRGDLPMVERNAIAAIVRNPKTDRYLMLKWKKADWVTPVTGGIEKGQSPEEAARREILEETGYRNLKLIRELTLVHSKFFHIPKNENRYGHFHNFYFELENDERTEIGEDELAKHEVIWMTLDELHAADLRPGFSYTLAEFEKEIIYTNAGILANSGEFTGRESEEAMWNIVAAAGGERATQYRIRDWLVSRQRYWDCPIPVVYDPEGKPHAVPAEHLPWTLPTDVGPEDAKNGKSPLAESKELHERTERIFGKGWTPEYDTFDVFMDSSWYFLRYLDSKDADKFSDDGMMKKWLPVNRYSGGSEHTTVHLLYARFFHKALYDLALVPTLEPFLERFNRGIILGTDGQKMSKRWGNVVNPDDVVKEFGTDAVRLYLAFIGPYNEPGHYPWKLDGVTGMRRFLERVVALSEKSGFTKSRNLNILRALAKAAKKVSEDSERFKFNTALSALMVLVRDMESEPEVSADAYRDLLTLLAPFAPHLAEHLWEKSGGEGSVHQAPWPSYDPKLLESSTASVVVQVAGKKRGSITVATAAGEAEVLAEALKLESVAIALDGKTPKRVIYVPGRILNLVI